jgi:hypothetical protein
MAEPVSLADAGNISGHSRPIAAKWAKLSIAARRLEGLSRTTSSGGRDGGTKSAMIELSHSWRFAAHPERMLYN